MGAPSELRRLSCSEVGLTKRAAAAEVGVVGAGVGVVGAVGAAAFECSRASLRSPQEGRRHP